MAIVIMINYHWTEGRSSNVVLMVANVVQIQTWLEMATVMIQRKKPECSLDVGSCCAKPKMVGDGNCKD